MERGKGVSTLGQSGNVAELLCKQKFCKVGEVQRFELLFLNKSFTSYGYGGGDSKVALQRLHFRDHSFHRKYLNSL